MKKILCLILVCCLCAALVGCGKTDTDKQTSSNPTQSNQEQSQTDDSNIDTITVQSDVIYDIVKTIQYDENDAILVNIKDDSNQKNNYTIFEFTNEQKSGTKYQLKNLHDEVIYEFESKKDFQYLITLGVASEDYTLWSGNTQFAAFHNSVNVEVVFTEEKIIEPTQPNIEQDVTADKNGVQISTAPSASANVNIKVEGSPSPIFHITNNNIMFLKISTYTGKN